MFSFSEIRDTEGTTFSKTEERKRSSPKFLSLEIGKIIERKHVGMSPFSTSKCSRNRFHESNGLLATFSSTKIEKIEIMWRGELSGMFDEFYSTPFPLSAYSHIVIVDVIVVARRSIADTHCWWSLILGHKDPLLTLQVFY